MSENFTSERLNAFVLYENQRRIYLVCFMLDQFYPDPLGDKIMKLRTLVAASLLAVTQAANAGLINFDNLALGDFDDIPTNYGSFGALGAGDARVGVTYSGSSGTTTHLDFWNTGYGDLNKVAFSPSNGTSAKISFAANSGWLIKSLSFDLAGWPNADLRADVVFGVGLLSVSIVNATIEGDFTGLRHTSFSATNSVGGSTAFIEWGTDWNVGIDNIAFEVMRDPDARIPEPGSLALLGVALAGLAARRKLSA